MCGKEDSNRGRERRAEPGAVCGLWLGAMVLGFGNTQLPPKQLAPKKPYPLTDRVSISTVGDQGDSTSGVPALSEDGRIVAFASRATTLVPNDTNAWWDTFVHDRATGTTERVSVKWDGSQGSSTELYPSLSADGRLVVFSSGGALVPEDDNYSVDVYLRDRQAGTTDLVSLTAGGGVNPGMACMDGVISADGSCVAFLSDSPYIVGGDTNSMGDIFVHDLATGAVTRVSVATDGTQGDAPSLPGGISADGRWVVFWTYASTLVPGDTNGAYDVFAHDRATGETRRVSVASDGTESNHHSWAPGISADGRYVSFTSQATTLVDVDTGGAPNVFLHDLVTGETTLISVTASGTEAAGGICNRYSLSANGDRVLFSSFSPLIVPGGTNGWSHVFYRDRLQGRSWQVSVDSRGVEGNSNSGLHSDIYTWMADLNGAISGDGQFMAYDSGSTNLVPNDTNLQMDVFVHGPRF